MLTSRIFYCPAWTYSQRMDHRDPGLEAAPVIPVTSPEQAKIDQDTKGGGTAAVVMKPATLEVIGLAIHSVGLL